MQQSEVMPGSNGGRGNSSVRPSPAPEVEGDNVSLGENGKG